LSKTTPVSPPTRPRRGADSFEAQRPRRKMLFSDPAAGGDWIRNTVLENSSRRAFLWRPLAMPTLQRFLIQRPLLSSETRPVIKFTRRSFAQAGRQRKKGSSPCLRGEPDFRTGRFERKKPMESTWIPTESGFLGQQWVGMKTLHDAEDSECLTTRICGSIWVFWSRREN
jgi:hypothetical protein